MGDLVYPEEKVELGLHTLALCGGSTKRAADILEAEGNRVPESTLRMWRDRTQARRYLEIKSEIQSQNREIQASRAEDMVARATDADEMLVDRVLETAQQVEIENTQDVANLARSASSIAQVADIHQRNANLLREKPTQISRVENPAEIIRELEALGIARRDGAVDTTGEEI